MRIIAGKYKGRILKSPPDLKTRPTSDRLRETLFNILAPQINEDLRFLDLCAGSGAIGIEALSRGVRHTTFVEIARRNCAIIEENLDKLQIDENNTEVICETAEKFLSKCQESFDIVYFDPPYQNDYSQVIKLLSEKKSKLLNSEGILIAEHLHKINLPDLSGDLRRWRIVKQGESALSFYQFK